MIRNNTHSTTLCNTHAEPLILHPATTPQLQLQQTRLPPRRPDTIRYDTIRLFDIPTYLPHLVNPIHKAEHRNTPILSTIFNMAADSNLPHHFSDLPSLIPSSPCSASCSRRCRCLDSIALHVRGSDPRCIIINHVSRVVCVVLSVRMPKLVHPSFIIVVLLCSLSFTALPALEPSVVYH
jgi:hypothetical protein